MIIINEILGILNLLNLVHFVHLQHISIHTKHIPSAQQVFVAKATMLENVGLYSYTRLLWISIYYFFCTFLPFDTICTLKFCVLIEDICGFLWSLISIKFGNRTTLKSGCIFQLMEVIISIQIAFEPKCSLSKYALALKESVAMLRNRPN